MANRIKGITVEINGDVTGLDKALQSVNSHILSTQNQLRDVEKLLKLDPTNTELLAQKERILGEAAAETSKKLEALRSAAAAVTVDNAKAEEYKKALSGITAQSTKAENELKKLKARMNELEKGGKLETKEYTELQEKAKGCETRLEALKQKRNELYEQFGRPISQAQFDALQREIIATEQKLSGLGETGKKTGTVLTEEIGDKLDGVFNATKILAFTEVLKTAVGTLENFAEGFMEIADASIEFESAMAAVKRTVGGGDDFIAELGESFDALALSIPITAEEMAAVAATAGQLGIAAEDVEKFTEIMAKLDTATDLDAESAATLLAQFATVTGTKDYERLGSTIAALGDSTATTASKIVEMSQGMAAAASVAGFKETDILALAAAVGSLGIEAQAGSTAMQNSIQRINKAVELGNEELAQYAEVANMTAESFAQAWKEDPAKAFEAYISGLSDIERLGRSSVVILDELGISNAREVKAVQGLSEAEGLLSKTLTLANAAWEENTALNEKAGIMYGTTEAKLTMLKSAAEQLKVAIGDKLTPAIKLFAEWGTEALSSLTELVKGEDEAAKGVDAYAEAVEELNRSYIKNTENEEYNLLLAEQYLKKLDELNRYQVLNNEQRIEYAALVEKLNGLYPDLNLLIDEETGRLEGSTKAIYENIEAMKEQAAQQYLAQKYKDQIGAATELQLDRTSKQVELDAATAELEVLRKQTDVLDVRIAELQTRIEQARAAGENPDRTELEEYNSIVEKYAEYSKRISELLNQQKNLREAISLDDDKLASINEEIERAKKAYEEFAEFGEIGYSVGEKFASRLTDAIEDKTFAVGEAMSKMLSEAYSLYVPVDYAATQNGGNTLQNGGAAEAGNTSGSETTINIYPQSVDENTLAYLLNEVNRKLVG